MSDRPVSPGLVNPDFASPSPTEYNSETDLINNIYGTDIAFAFTDNMRNVIAQRGNRHVPFTVTSALRPTDYKEEWEPKKRRSDAYIATQLQVLTYLDTHAADELTAAQAHFFTENAGTKPFGPSVKQAVELCYFMRSHGFDTYVKLVPRRNKIQLYVANRDALDRSQDEIYWEQDLKTGESVSMSVISRGGGGTRGSRRGALADIWAAVSTPIGA